MTSIKESRSSCSLRGWRPTAKMTKVIKQMDKEYERLVTYNFINWFWTQEHLKKNIQTTSHAYMAWLEATRQADERNKTNFIE